MLGHVPEGGIGDDANLLDVLVVVSHEAEVGRHCSETFPSGKPRGFDDEAGEPSGFSNKWVDRFRELLKVAFCERGLGSHI